MTIVEKLTAEDFRTMAKNCDRADHVSLTEKQMHHLISLPHSYSIFVDGKLVAVAGIAEYWKGRGEVWAMVDRSSKKHFFILHNVVKRFLELCPIRRIEAAIETDFEEGHRWVKALGFRLDAVNLEAFFPNGTNASLYSMVKHG